MLSGRLSELEASLVAQLELCRQLQTGLPMTAHAASRPLTILAAQAAQQQTRIFSAVLRRMQRTLIALHHALQAAPLTYAPPAACGKNRSF